tara:strand:+ start:122 stop:997 length:876 start_codon:yes stop_codon:yes gene_type:complete
MKADGRLPSFVVAGTQKAATTWLYECLKEHPQVHVPEIKELHFFCDPRDCGKSRRERGEDWYRAQFAAPPGCLEAGELSIDYMYYRQIPEQLAAMNPDLKVLFILRDPVERAYSAYWMSRRNHVDYPPFNAFVRSDSEFVSRGLYWRQIERYRRCFPAEQIKVMIYEAIPEDPGAFLAEVFAFLGVDPAVRPPSMHQRIAATRAMNPAASSVYYGAASRVLRLPPVLWGWRRFKRLSGLRQARPRGVGATRPAPRYAPMCPEERQLLKGLYREETERLFDMLGRRVEQWDT